MTKRDILEELPRLTAAEREEIRLRLSELDGDEWMDDGGLTDEQKKTIESRLAELERNPESAIPWAVAESRLKSRYGK